VGSVGCNTRVCNPRIVKPSIVAVDVVVLVFKSEIFVRSLKTKHVIYVFDKVQILQKTLRTKTRTNDVALLCIRQRGMYCALLHNLTD
jgi:hypothetical protein